MIRMYLANDRYASMIDEEIESLKNLKIKRIIKYV